MGRKCKEEGENEMLGVGRYRLEGNFFAFFLTCVMTRDGGTGSMTYTAIHFETSHVTRFKIGDEQHTTPALGR